VVEQRAARAYLDETVLDAALRRIRWVYENHEHVGVNYSGGKDSTVVLGLTRIVAAELGRGPVDVLFVDQEAEWQAVIDHVREVGELPDVNLHWMQMPIRISSASSASEQWLYCWREGAEWMREKEPGTIHANDLGTETFKDIFAAWQLANYPDTSAAQLAGVRTEESPSRLLGLTTYETWKGQTWGTRPSKKREHFTWYPIYDWRLSDVWLAIHEHGWPYCSLYDTYYRYGVSPRLMRVSSLHHEGAIRQMFMLQEVEPDTWNALCRRLDGAHTAGQLNWSAFKVEELPPMFRSWEEYPDHLLENLVTDAEQRERLRRKFAQAAEKYRHDERTYRELLRTEIQALLVGDDHGHKLTVFVASHLSSNRGAISGRTTL